MKKYLNIKSKELREKLIKNDKQRIKEMKKWWQKILPRKESLLRQLIDIQLNNKLK